MISVYFCVNTLGCGEHCSVSIHTVCGSDGLKKLELVLGAMEWVLCVSSLWPAEGAASGDDPEGSCAALSPAVQSGFYCTPPQGHRQTPDVAEQQKCGRRQGRRRVGRVWLERQNVEPFKRLFSRRKCRYMVVGGHSWDFLSPQKQASRFSVPVFFPPSSSILFDARTTHILSGSLPSDDRWYKNLSDMTTVQICDCSYVHMTDQHLFCVYIKLINSCQGAVDFFPLFIKGKIDEKHRVFSNSGANVFIWHLEVETLIKVKGTMHHSKPVSCDLHGVSKLSAGDSLESHVLQGLLPSTSFLQVRFDMTGCEFM